MFSTDIKEIEAQIDAIDPIQYGKTRNYLNGAVTKLSPYISRGIISTRQIYDRMIAKGYKLYQMEKFVQELAWRDYYQQIWIAKGNAIDKDLKKEQPDVRYHGIPTAIVNATTGITAIDEGIKFFYTTGYLHNHLRMYIASIVCNVSRCHWLAPAQWMYYHLKDADWASNALSWQWTAAAFSNKKYYANQENINKYCDTDDRDTFLDVSYDAFESLAIPEVLKEAELLQLTTSLPASTVTHIDNTKATYLYNFYHLNPDTWDKFPGNHILLLEPDFFSKYPVSNNTMEFVLALAKNINDLQIFTGSFDDLVKKHDIDVSKILYKEHPENSHYRGVKIQRDWLVPEVVGAYPSFFSYWKKVGKQLKK